MATNKQFDKFDFFTEVEVKILHYVASRSVIKNKAGYKAEDFRGLILQTSNGRPYGCNSSVATVINNALRDMVVRELATRIRETCFGRPYIYIFSHTVVSAISRRLKEMDDFGLKVQEQTILQLVNRYNANKESLVKENVPGVSTVRILLDDEQYFKRIESTELDIVTVSYTPTELAQTLYKRWCEIIDIYTAD